MRGICGRGKAFADRTETSARHSMNMPFRSALQVQADVLYALILREMNSRLGQSRVGFFWVLIEPAAHLIVPVIMYSVIRQRVLPGQEYVVFLLYGMVPFLLFKNTYTQTLEGVSGGTVLAYRQVHLMDVFVARLVASTLFECFLMILVLCGLAFFGYDVLPDKPLEFLILLLLPVLLGFGVGLVLAAIVSFVPDFRSLLRFTTSFLYLATGVLFPLSRFSDHIIDILAWNPVLHVVEACRWAGLPHYRTIRQFNLFIPLWVTLLTLAAGLSLYRLRVLNKVTA